LLQPLPLFLAEADCFPDNVRQTNRRAPAVRAQVLAEQPFYDLIGRTVLLPRPPL
jgi:hypothetical protein